MKDSFTSIFLALMLIAGVSFVPAFVAAQAVPAPTIPSGGVMQEPTPIATTTSTQASFDWRWLLPLLLIPVLYFVLRKDEELGHDSYDSPDNDRRSYVGVKGGRAKKKIDHDDDVI